MRKWTGNDPVRLLIDKNLKISENSALMDNSIKTIVLTEKDVHSDSANIQFEKITFSGNIADEVCRVCHENEIQSVIIEGGRNTLQQFIDANLWDEARVFTGNASFGAGTRAPILSAERNSEKQIADDRLEIFKNNRAKNL